MVLSEISQEDGLKQVAKYQMLLRRKIANNADFAYGVLVSIVYTQECGWKPCLDSLSANEIELLDEFMELEVRSQDFLPFPRSFMVDLSDDEAIEEKKRELRPRYLAIDKLIKAAKKN